MGTSTKRLYLRLQADLGAEFDRVVSVKEGSNSLVCFARRILDGHEVAIKVIDCRALIDDEQEAIKLVREIQVKLPPPSFSSSFSLLVPLLRS